MRDLAGLARFDDQGHLRALPFTHQVVVKRGQGQQRRNGRVVFVQPAVAQYQDAITVADGLIRAPANEIQAALEFLPAAVNAIKGLNGGGQEVAPADAAQSFEIEIGEDGMRQL